MTPQLRLLVERLLLLLSWVAMSFVTLLNVILTAFGAFNYVFQHGDVIDEQT